MSTAKIKAIRVTHPFWDKVDKNGPTVRPELGSCWIWTAGKDTDGYGLFETPEGKRGAHKVSLEMRLGRKLKKGEVAMHLCDNPPCVNGSHLEPGSNADNLRDMADKGRARGGRRTKDGREPRNRRDTE